MLLIRSLRNNAKVAQQCTFRCYSQRKRTSKAFGSFMSASIDDLVQQDDTPEPPFELAQWEDLEQLQFSRHLLKSHFLLDEEWTFVNHGAFGATLSELELECQRWRLYLELMPADMLSCVMPPVHTATTAALHRQRAAASPGQHSP
eukprot:9378-Heterococcus_DN1.PRE.3